MKKKSDLWFCSNPSLTKIFRELKIAIFIILASISIASGSIIELQQQSIKGKVSDSKGEPLTGVNVVVKGTTIGAANTKMNGRVWWNKL